MFAKMFIYERLEQILTIICSYVNILSVIKQNVNTKNLYKKGKILC